MVLPVRLENFDLNLLVMLDTLLREQNVSRTATLLNVTQPAVSNGLSRLRQHFNDPLLVRVGSHFSLTALASELRAPLAQTLIDLRGVIHARVQFDPSTSRAKLVIACSDWFATTHVARLVRKLSSIAPLMQLEHRPISQQARERMVEGTLDLLVMREERLVPDHPSQLLAVSRVAVIGCAEHSPFAGAEITRGLLAHRPQILALAPDGQPIMPHVHPLLTQESIAVMTSSVSLLPVIVMGTRYIAFMPLDAARHYASVFPICYAHVTDGAPSRIFMQWQRQRLNDPVIAWLRQQLGVIQEVVSGEDGAGDKGDKILPAALRAG